MAIQQELERFDNSLALLASQTGFGASFLNKPESILVEATSRGQYIKLQEQFAADSMFMAVMEVNWRFLTIARTTGSYVLPHFGDINWVEIAEPVHDTPVSQPPRVKSVSFYVDDLVGTHNALAARRLQPKAIDDGLAIKLKGAADVIFTDVGVSYSIEKYVENGVATQIQLHSD